MWNFKHHNHWHRSRKFSWNRKKDVLPGKIINTKNTDHFFYFLFLFCPNFINNSEYLLVIFSKGSFKHLRIHSSEAKKYLHIHIRKTSTQIQKCFAKMISLWFFFGNFRKFSWRLKRPWLREMTLYDDVSLWGWETFIHGKVYISERAREQIELIYYSRRKKKRRKSLHFPDKLSLFVARFRERGLW